MTPESTPETPEARFVLILERSSPSPVAEAGRIVAAQLGSHPADAAARIRYGGGLIADGLTEEAADRLAAGLREIGMRTRKVEEDRWAVVSPGYQALALELLEDTLLARLPSESELVVPREEVFAVDAYLLAVERSAAETEEPWSRGRRKSAKERRRRLRAGADAVAGDRHPELLRAAALIPPDLRALSPRGERLVENLRKAGHQEAELRLTLYCADPVGPLHVRKDRFDYSCLGDQKREHSVDNFLLLLDEVLAEFPRLWNRESVEEFLRDLDPERIYRVKEEEVESFHRWILQWIRIELEDEPRRDARGKEDPE